MHALPPILNVLIVDDSHDDAMLIARHIRKQGYEVTWERVDTAEDMLKALRETRWDVIISDVNIPGFGAASALALYKDVGCGCPFIVVSGMVGEEAAVSLLKAGAGDFVLKSNLARLVTALEREYKDWQVREEKARAEEALRASEERYALAARGANDGLWDWDLIGGGIYLSARWQEIVGHAPGLGSGLPPDPEEWFGRVHPDDREDVHAAIALHIAGLSPTLSIEHRLRHADGGWRWVLARGMAVRNEAGKPLRMAGSLTDVTASKLAEQEIRKAKDELEHALASKTRFLAAASHDLRQPFQAMRLYQHMLSEKVADPACRKMVGALGEAMSAGEALLHALLDVSTLDAGIVPVNRSTFPALDVASAVAREFEQEARSRSIDLRVAGAADVVDSDTTLLSRILRNLLSNALRYTPNGGRVLVACRRRGPALAIEVWDTGIGIPPDMQEAVFEDFVQVGNPERDRRHGLGLGLAIVRRTARLLGCEVHLRSQPGKGSTFTITLPRVAPVSAPNVVHLATRKEGPKPMDAQHILLIEDDLIQGTALCQLLEVWGYTVTLAGTAEDAFAHMAGAAAMPRLIISDFRLPGEFNGVQAVARICNEARRHIPAIIVTGDTAPERIKEATATGCRLLHKPYDPAVLKATMEAISEPAATGGRDTGRRE
ncbi:MAG TPA: response regulator [Azospirillum sp.]|nr:response regulator [Azospirillum sp.]